MLISVGASEGSAAEKNVDEGLKDWDAACDDDDTSLNTTMLLAQYFLHEELACTHTVQITRSDVSPIRLISHSTPEYLYSV